MSPHAMRAPKQNSSTGMGSSYPGSHIHLHKRAPHAIIWFANFIILAKLIYA